jgi:hypothetical protein
MASSNTDNKRLFNIDILILDANNSKYLKEVSKLNIFESNSQVFDPKGLFSTDIFGPVGSSSRNSMFGYVDIKLNVLHPLVYQHIINLRSFYKDILSGSKYAVFDKTTKDFIITDRENGRTGYTFFMEYIHKLNLTDNDSNQRGFRIQFINKYSRSEYFINKWLVLPAGLRDYSVDENGKPSEDEVNGVYRKLLNTTLMLKNMNVSDENMYLLDSVRFKLQNILLEIYEHFKTLLDGKNKFIQGKWAKRAISYGTRNVITPIIETITDLDNTENTVGMNDTVVGLYQFSKGISPITMNRLQTVFISKILNPDSLKALLVNPATMESELVEITAKKRDEWLSLEGLDNVISKLGQEDIRKEPVKIDKYYFCLVGDFGDKIDIVFNTKSLPDDYDKSKLRPITYMELIYVAIYDVRKKYPAFLTRYPVAGLGGIYPTNLFVKTTTKGRDVKISLEGYYKDNLMHEYPILSEEFVSSMSMHASHISRAGADFDGDMCSLNILYTDESIKEIEKILNSKTYYVTPDGNITYSFKTEPLEYVLGHMTDFKE